MNILLGGGPTGPTGITRLVPGITFIADWQDDPWGVTQNGGYMEDKAAHLAAHPGIVQQKGVMLATLALNGQDDIDGFTLTPAGNYYSSLATNLILPAGGSGAPDGKAPEGMFEMLLRFPNASTRAIPMPPPAGFVVRNIPLGTTLATRVGSSALAVKVFECDGAGGQAGRLELRGDPIGLDLGAMRLVGQHFRVPNTSKVLLDSDSDTHVRYAALLVAEEVGAAAESTGQGTLAALAARVAAAAVSSTQHPETAASGAGPVYAVWEASARFDGGPNLSVARNLTCSERGGLRNQTVHTQWDCLLRRRVDGAELVPGPLRVNGRRL